MKIITKIISVILLAVILGTGIYIEKKLNEYRTEWDQRKAVSELARSMPGQSIKEDVKKAAEGAYVPPDIEALKSGMPDIKGWICLPGTQIDYPVVQGRDNDQYLHRTVYGQYSNAGSIFIESSIMYPFKEFNTIIYGHHMLSGSMFTGLKDFKDEKYFDEHKRIRLTTEDGDYDILVAAFLHESADSDIYTTGFTDDASCREYIDLINSRAVHIRDAGIDEHSRLVTLSTCAYEWSDARYIVIGKITEHKTEEVEAEYAEPLFPADGRINPWLLAMIGTGVIMAGSVFLTLKR